MTTDRDIRMPVRLVECIHGSVLGACPVDGCTHAGARDGHQTAVDAGPVPARPLGTLRRVRGHCRTEQAHREVRRPLDPRGVRLMDPTHGKFAAIVPLEDRSTCIGEACRRRYAGSIPIAIRRKVWERDGKACVYCGVAVVRANGPTQRSTDHVRPRSKGGCDHTPNLLTACKSCNSKKGTKGFHRFVSEQRLVESGALPAALVAYLGSLAALQPWINPCGLTVQAQFPDLTPEVLAWADVVGCTVTQGPFQITLTPEST